ncbi:hypothetical protein IC575_005851 [Cucumis melo]
MDMEDFWRREGIDIYGKTGVLNDIELSLKSLCLEWTKEKQNAKWLLTTRNLKIVNSLTIFQRNINRLFLMSLLL